MNTILSRTFKLSFFLFAFACIETYAQKTDDLKVSFDYIRLPLEPIDPAITTYTGSIEMPYAAELAGILENEQSAYASAYSDWQTACAEIDRKNEASLAVYNEEKKQIDIEYQESLDEWNNRSTGKKLGEKLFELDEGRPTRRPYPAYNRIPYPPEPKLTDQVYPVIHNTDQLKSQYLVLDGYQWSDDPSNAVNITFNLSGTEFLGEEIKEIKNRVKKKDGSYSYVFKYHYEIKMRHVMGVKVVLPDGTVLMDEYPEELSEIQTLSTVTKSTRSELTNWWETEKKNFIERNDIKLTESNVAFMNELVNNNYGFSKLTRNATIYTVKPKKYEYDEFEEALEYMKDAARVSTKRDEDFAEKLAKAIDLWEQALMESDLENKKARIDNQVTSATLINLAESKCWANKHEEALDHLKTIKEIDIKQYRKQIPALKEFIKDHQYRWEAKL